MSKQKKNGHTKKKANGVDLRKVPKEKRPKPSTGQSAKERDLPYDDLNGDEQSLVKLLDGKSGGPRIVRTVEFMSEAMDGDNPKLQTRNALRRLVSCGWVDNVGRGQYQISEKGRKRMARA
jgi:hypothetical protein